MTTKPTIQADKSVGATLGAAEWNVNALQQARWTQEVIAGTNADKIPGAALANPLAAPGPVSFHNDANFLAQLVGGNPVVQFDSGPDEFAYIRASNQFQWIVNAALIMQLDSAGQLTGLGFYRSTEVTITTGNNANFAHGLAAKPYFVHGLWGTVTNNNFTQIDKAAGTVTFGNQDAVNINVANASGANAFVVVAVMK